jgi:hypothetical protein
MGLAGLVHVLAAAPEGCETFGRSPSPVGTRGRERQTERGGEREIERECVCVARMCVDVGQVECS